METSSEAPEKLDALLLMATVLGSALDDAGASAGAVDRAIASALINHADHGAVMLKVAQVLHRRGDADLALTLLESVARHAADARIDAELALLHEAAGDPHTALAWCWRALAKDPFVVSLYVQAARLECATGRPAAGLGLLKRMAGVDTDDPALNAEWAGLLWRHGDAAGSIPRFERAYAAGRDDPLFLTEFIDLLTGEAMYARVLELPPFGEPGSALRAYWLRMQAHARLAVCIDRAEALQRARRREEEGRWLEPEALVGRIRRAVAARQPLSMVRLGDGEARFLIWSTPELQGDLDADQLYTVGDVPWRSWFGGDIADVEPHSMAALRRDFVSAIETADLLGVSSLFRLRQDTGHFGFIETQEAFVADLLGKRDDVSFFDALGNLDLEKTEPPLSHALKDLDFLGLISPHPDLEAKLRRHLRPLKTRAYVVPAEARQADLSAAGRDAHFPTVYQALLGELHVPFPGAVYLVGAGLLGKIYCARIKQLGGIALDIGSLVDGWCGLDTRPGMAAAVAPLA